MNIPNHVALIPDGNRRWARKRGLPSFIGHKKGAETLEKIIYEVISLNISSFSFWGSSLDNITKRSKSEVNYLFNIFEASGGYLFPSALVNSMESGFQVK